MSETKKYFVFISYSSKDNEDDNKWAEWLRYELDHWHLPATYNNLGRKPVRDNLREVFRDRDGFSAGEEWDKQAEAKLKESQNLIVICSPNAAQSDAVNKEIEIFINQGKEKSIFPFIIDGNGPDDYFPPALKYSKVGGDVKKDGGRDKAFIKVVAGMLGVNFDDLYNKYEIEKAEQAQLEREKREKLQIAQSRFVAEKVKSVAKEDSYLARRLAVEVLPKDLKNPDRPYTPEADVALRYSYYKHNMVLRGHTDSVDSAVFSPDGNRILSTTSGIIKVWDVETGLNTHTIEIDFSGADFYDDSDHIIIFPSKPLTPLVEVRDLNTGEIVRHKIFSNSVNFPTFDNFFIPPFGDFFISPSKNFVVDSLYQLWDIKKGELVKSLYSKTEKIDFGSNMYEVSFSQDETMIAVIKGCQVRVWDMLTDEFVLLPEEHSDTISSIDFSPKGKKLVSASKDKTLKIWDIETKSVLNTLNSHYEGHSEPISAVAYCPDGKKIVSGDENGIMILWDADTGVVIRKNEGPTNTIRSVRFSTDGKQFVSTSLYDNTIRIWDVEENRELHSYYDNGLCWFNPLAVSPIDGIIAYAIENSLLLWNTNIKSFIRAMCNHTGDIYSMAFSPNGKQIVTASEDKTLLLWDVATGDMIQSFIGHSDGVWHVAFSPNGEQIISTSKDKSIKIWEVESGECVLTKPVSAWMAAFNPKDDQIVYTTRDGKMVFCDSFSCEEVNYIDVSKSKFLSFAFSPDGKHIVTSSSREGILELWDAKTGNHIDTLSDPSVDSVDSGLPGVVAYSIEGDRIVSVFGVHSISIWDEKSGALIQRIDGRSSDYHSWHWRWISGIGFSSDGEAIISASADKFIISNLANESVRCVMRKPLYDIVGTVALSPDEKWLAVRNGNMIIIRDFKAGKIHKILIGLTEHIHSIAFNAKGNLLVTISEDNTIRIWSVDSGKEIRRTYRKHEIIGSAYFSPINTCIVYITRYDFDDFFKNRYATYHNISIHDNISIHGEKAIIRRNNDGIVLVGHSDAINSALFNSKEEMVVTSSSDKTIIVWNAGNGKRIHALNGHTDSVNYATFSVDGCYIVSASNDHTVILWDVNNGNLLRTFIGHRERVICVCISPDNNKIVSVSADKSVIIWDAQTGEATKVLKDYVSNEGISKSRVSVEFSVDGKIIRINDNDNFSVVDSVNGRSALNPAIHIWNYENDTIISSFLDHSDPIESIQFSKDGKSFVSASRNGIKIWDASTCTLTKKFENEGLMGLEFAMFGAEDNTIISKDFYNVLKWDVDSGAIMRRIDKVSHHYCISPDGRYLVSETDKNTIAVRDIETNTPLQTIKKPQYGYDSMAFSPIGNKIILTDYDSIYIWDFPPLQELIDKTREQFKDNPLTLEERRQYYLE